MSLSSNPDPGSPTARPTHDGPFTILKVVYEDSPPSVFLPAPGPTPNSIVPEPEDGASVQTVIATELRAATKSPGSGAPKVIVQFEKIQATVQVTDCRVALVCSNYLKAKKMHPYTLGALPITATANIINKARANKRQSGNVLVGQVRYPWLTSLGFKELAGWRSRINVVRLTIANPQREGIAPTLVLDICLPGLPTGAMAHDIARRAAHYRLTYADGQLPDKTRRRLEQLVTDPPLPAKPEGFVIYDFNGEPRPTEP